MNIDYQQLAKIIVERLEAEGYFNNCLNCGWWNNVKEQCDKFREKPPLKVIVKGCEQHEIIPF